jgi:hypothetical protein
MATPRKQRTETPSSVPLPDEKLLTLVPALEELTAWWQERKATLAKATDTTQETERMTFHVERRWIEAIRRQADLDGLTITEVVNQAFRQHFKGE